MRTSSRYLGYCLVLASSVAFAAPPASKNPNRIEPPPPPGLDDPGVETPATPADPAAPPDAGKSDNDPLAPLPKPDTRPVRDKGSRDAAANSERIAQSQMTSRQQGTDTVEEYRQNGHVWMIRIVPQNGPVQTFMDSSGNGRLNRDPQEGPIAPVYFSLYDWN